MRKLTTIHKHQRGLTLVELVIAMALFGMVAGAILTSFSNIMVASARTSSQMTAARQVQTAGYWVSQDALQAQAPGDPGFPLTLTIPYYVGEEHDSELVYRTVVYQVVDGNLQRIAQDHESDPVTTIIAEHITAADFTEDNDQPGVYIFTVSATTSGGSTVTRQYMIEPRPGP